MEGKMGEKERGGEGCFEVTQNGREVYLDLGIRERSTRLRFLNFFGALMFKGESSSDLL